jgi:hypothetical protein
MAAIRAARRRISTQPRHAASRHHTRQWLSQARKLRALIQTQPAPCEAPFPRSLGRIAWRHCARGRHVPLVTYLFDAGRRAHKEAIASRPPAETSQSKGTSAWATLSQMRAHATPNGLSGHAICAVGASRRDASRAVDAEGCLAQLVQSPDDASIRFPYTYDQLLEAIASTRGDGAHFFLTLYLQGHKESVGVERFRRLLETAKLRGQDEVSVHVTIAELDPTYALEMPRLLRSASSVGAQQVLLASLPDVLPRDIQNVGVADQLEAWLRRRVKRPSYLENGASWEIPCVVLSVLYSTDASRARALLADMEPHLDERERPLAQAAHESDDDKGFETILSEWRSMDGTKREPSPSEIAEQDAEIEREAAKYMRRLGFQPSG